MLRTVMMWVEYELGSVYCGISFAQRALLGASLAARSS